MPTTFPPELVQEIVDICALWSARESKDTVNKCLLVSKSFYAAARRRVFANLVLSERYPNRLETTAQLLRFKHPDHYLSPIHTLVRTLTLEANQGSSENNDGVYFASQDFLDAIKYFTDISLPYRGIRELCVRGCNPTGAAEYQHVLPWDLISPPTQQSIVKIWSSPSVTTVLLRRIILPESVLTAIAGTPNCQRLSLSRIQTVTTAPGSVQAPSPTPTPDLDFNLISLALDRPREAVCYSIAVQWISSYNTLDTLRELNFLQRTPSKVDLGLWLRRTPRLKYLGLPRLRTSYFTEFSVFPDTLRSLTRLYLARFGPVGKSMRPRTYTLPNGQQPIMLDDHIDIFAERYWPPLQLLPKTITHLSITTDVRNLSPDHWVWCESSKRPKFVARLIVSRRACNYWDALAWALSNCDVPHVTMTMGFQCKVAADSEPLSELTVKSMESGARADMLDALAECNRLRSIPITPVLTVRLRK